MSIDFYTQKNEYLAKDIEELLEMLFSGSYISGPLEPAIIEKVGNMKTVISRIKKIT